MSLTHDIQQPGWVGDSARNVVALAEALLSGEVLCIYRKGTSRDRFMNGAYYTSVDITKFQEGESANWKEVRTKYWAIGDEPDMYTMVGLKKDKGDGYIVNRKYRQGVCERKGSKWENHTITKIWTEVDEAPDGEWVIWPHMEELLGDNYSVVDGALVVTDEALIKNRIEEIKKCQLTAM